MYWATLIHVLSNRSTSLASFNLSPKSILLTTQFVTFHISVELPLSKCMSV